MRRSRGLLAGRAIRAVKLTALVLALASGPGRAPAADLYVATNGTGDGSSWANAMGSIQDGIDAISGIYSTNTVWVSNGVYEVGGVTNFPTGMGLTNRVAIYKAITVRSANNDPTNTIIKGAWNPLTTNGPAAVRCVYMTNGSSLIGFMLTNGATWSTIETGGILNSNRMGGGILCYSVNTVISNCVIAGNAANYFGGGAGNWRLNANSPSVNTGTNYSWMADSTDARSKDLDGRSRIDKFGRRVDMGCYEFLPSGTMLTVR